MSRRFLIFGAFVVVGSALGASCAAGSQTSGSGAGGGAGGSAGASSSSGLSSTGGSGGGIAMATGAGGTSGVGGGCVGVSSKADPIPLDIFVMLDQSGSMLTDAGNGMSRWQTVQSAFTTFVQQPSAAGIGMGIQYFGLPDPSVPGCQQQTCTGDGDCMMGCTTCMPQGVCESSFNPDIDSCNAIDYAWADVAIQTLPGAGPAIMSSIASHAPGTNTPTAPALQGAIQYASTWETAHPSHVTVVAFATDGEPSECDQNLSDIDAIAAAGFAATPSIKTFVIGVGPSLGALDGIAAAGGTTQAFHVDVNTMATQEFLSALNTIRGAALACIYQIPAPPPGMTLNFGEVNVVFHPGGGKPTQTFPKVKDAAHCPANGDGWYYDDNAMPTEIILCSKTCTKISDLVNGELDVVLGCMTVVP
jgi:hypothetical protein